MPKTKPAAWAGVRYAKASHGEDCALCESQTLSPPLCRDCRRNGLITVRTGPWVAWLPEALSGLPPGAGAATIYARLGRIVQPTACMGQFRLSLLNTKRALLLRGIIRANDLAVDPAGVARYLESEQRRADDRPETRAEHERASKGAWDA